ncbi:MAG: symmetrical bis(5'-nucleosyl)-tetraphosphatase [Deltaproteobacteria bacterium]
MARYAIGDIQGCMASLERMLVAIEYQRGRDTLWLTGDLVNRGPRSLDVLHWARAQGDAVITILGNHDLHLLARASGVAAEKKRDTLEPILHAPDRDELIAWVRTRPFAHIEDDFILIHAGLHPSWTSDDILAHARELERELAGDKWHDFMAATAGKAPAWDRSLAGPERWRALLSYFVRARMLDQSAHIVADYDGPPSGAPPGTVPWFAMPAKWTNRTAVFGHWAALGLDVGPRHLGLDTGCVWGNFLTAIRLDDRRVFQVKAVEAAS